MNDRPQIESNAQSISAESSQEEYLVFGLLAEELEAARIAGREPEITRLIQDYPDYTDQIRKLLPTLQSLNEFANDSSSVGVEEPIERHCGTLGDFRILGEIGRGGMGIVYKAEQISLRRMVALKVLPFAAVLDTKQLQRFKNEALAAAALKHPNIVNVHSVGCERSIHYYAMELIEGPSLAEVINDLSREKMDRDPLPDDATTRANFETPTVGSLSSHYSNNRKEFYRAVARIAIQAAEALDYIHQMGIVHRDVKPSNLLLDQEGKVWVADLGLARVQPEGNLTITGDLIGTIRYMSPEQASGNPALVDRRSDVYSLGAVLYELITLVPVLRANNRQSLLRELDKSNPSLPSLTDPRVPKDLETIVLKALAKSPHERYLTAQHMADDLKRFVNHRPIVARRVGRFGQLSSWARRNPAIASLMTMVFLLLVALSVGSTAVAWQQYQKAVLEEREARVRELEIYARDMKLTSHQLDQGNTLGAVQTLQRWEQRDPQNLLRGFEFRFLANRCKSVAASRTIAGSIDQFSAEYSPCGRYLVTCSFGEAVIWDARSADKRIETIEIPVGGAWVRFLTDTELVFAGVDGSLFIWDIDLKRPTKRFKIDTPTRERAIRQLAVSRDGLLVAVSAGNLMSNLVSVEQPGHVHVWHREQGWVKRLDNFRSAPSITFNHDGTQLIVGCGRGELRAWDTTDWTALRSVPFGKGPITSVTANRRGSRLAIARRGRTDDHRTNQIVVCDADTWSTEISLGQVNQISCLRFSPNGDQLAAASHDGAVTLVDFRQDRTVRTPPIHQAWIYELGWSPDGRYLFTCSCDDTTRIWRVRDLWDSTEMGIRFDKHVGSPNGVTFVDSTGKSACSANENGDVFLWNVDSPSDFQRFRVTSDDTNIILPIVSPSGNTLALICGNWPLNDGPGRVDFVDLQSRELLGSVDLPRGRMGHGGAFSPDSKFLAVPCKRYVSIIDVEKMEIAKGGDLGPFERWIKDVDFSSSEPIFAFTGDHGKIHLHDADTFQPIGKPIQAQEAGLHGLRFSPDGRSFATCGSSHRVKIWDLANPHVPQKILKENPSGLLHVSFSPDGSRVLTGGKDGKLRLWHAESGEELLVLDSGTVWLGSGSFSADGNSMITAGRYATVFRAPANLSLEFDLHYLPHLGCDPR